MGNKKIIIKNCPAIYRKFRINESGAVYVYEYRCNHNLLVSCQDCTDCVMKQIVELCKNVDCPCNYQGDNCFGCWIGGKKRISRRYFKTFSYTGD